MSYRDEHVSYDGEPKYPSMDEVVVEVGTADVAEPRKGKLRNPETDTKYPIGAKLAEAPELLLFEAELPTGEQVILMLASSLEHNDYIFRNEEVLRGFAQKAVELETVHRAQYPAAKPINMHLFFPRIIDGFTTDASQGGRRALIVAYPDVIKSLVEMRPLSSLKKANQHVDRKTLIWILGKALKVMVFAHDMGMELNLSSANLLIEPLRFHGVHIFDWTTAIQYADKVVSNEARARDIVKLARMVYHAANDLKPIHEGDAPEDGQEVTTVEDQTERFQAYFDKLMNGEYTDAFAAQEDLYALADANWARMWHEFELFNNE